MAIPTEEKTTYPTMERGHLYNVQQSSGGVQSDNAVKYFDNIACGFISVVCLATNCLNFAVFLKQGLNDSINVSLLTLVCWDLIKGLCGVVMRANIPLWIHDPTIMISWDIVMVSKVAYFQTLSNYVSYPVAAYISVERALCVSIPLHVKNIITPQLTTCVMLAISVVVSAMFVVMFFIYDVVYVVNRQTNSTIAIFTYSQFYHKHGQVVMKYYHWIGIINPVLSLVIIVVSTITINYNLQNSGNFRSTQIRNTDKKHSDHLSTRNRKVVKMLLVIILIFIFNLVPRIAHQVAKLVEPEYYIVRKYSNIFAICVVIVYVFDFANSSSNLFVFLAMSSSFRKTFLDIFPACKYTSLSLQKVAFEKWARKRV